MTISLVAAMGKNRVIGKTGARFGLPWDLPDDRTFFRTMTLGKPMIEGRKTYEATGRLLPERPTIILTHDRDFTVRGAQIAHTKQQALAMASTAAEELHAEEIMVIGGGKVFEEFLPDADRMYLTHIDGEFEGDAFFPEFDESQWHEASREHHPKDDRHANTFDIVTYDRVVK